MIKEKKTILVISLSATFMLLAIFLFSYIYYLNNYQDKLLPRSFLASHDISGMNRSNLAKLIDSCNLLVLPSIQESFGLVLIESWVRGKPVIVSDIPSLSELVTKSNGGLVFKADNPISLVQKINKLINSPSLCFQYGQNGLKYVKTNYIWEKVYQKIYQKIKFS